MTTHGKSRLHFDATRTAGDLRASLCGFVGVLTTDDVTQATCRLCLARLRSGTRARSRTARSVAMHLPSVADIASELHLALTAMAASLAPSAGFPPRITAPLWQSSCRGAEHRRCGDCDLCVWERDAQLWAHVSPWNEQVRLDRPADNDNGRARWPSVEAALLDLVRHELEGRRVSSTLGATLDRAARGETGALQRDPRRTDSRAVHHAMDVVHVAKALERAFDDEGPLSLADSVRVLVERTAGALAGVTTYEALSARYRVSEGTLRAVVRRGRERLTADLVARGLVRAPRVRARAAAVEASSWRSG